MSGRKGSVLGILALIIGISGLGLGGYAFISNLRMLSQINATVPMVRVYPSFSSVISGSIWYTIDFTVIDYDVGNDFNIVTDRFTCPYSGYYLISGMVAMSDLQDGERLFLGIVRNNTEYSAITITHASTTATISAGVVDTIYLYEGDTIELRVYHTGSGSRTVYGTSTGTYTYLIITFADNFELSLL